MQNRIFTPLLPVLLVLGQASANYSQKDWHAKNALDSNGYTGWAIGDRYGKPHTLTITTHKPSALAAGIPLHLVHHP